MPMSIYWFPKFKIVARSFFKHFLIDIGGHCVQISVLFFVGFPCMYVTCNTWSVHGRVIDSKGYFPILRFVILGKFVFLKTYYF
jgi:hypothetical protein